jgi:hypothetical protein
MKGVITALPRFLFFFFFFFFFFDKLNGFLAAP